MADKAIPDTQNTDTPLWHFALTLWQQEAAKNLCLQLQERGWSVTRLLCAGWLATQGAPYSGHEPASLREWRGNVTESIRSLKKSLSKSDSLHGTLRDTLARAELEAERIELYQAWQSIRGTRPANDAGGLTTEANLRQAAPTLPGSINETTEPMIRQLAQCIDATATNTARTGERLA